MDWVSTFKWYFIIPAISVFITFGHLLILYSLLTGYKNKYQTKMHNLFELIIGPAVGFFIASLAMFYSLVISLIASESFIFERWSLAISFVVLAYWLQLQHCKSYACHQLTKQQTILQNRINRVDRVR
jgi:hypothetical protein